ncbi:MAG: PspA/IM30 family protein [Bacillota bacterium]|nr:PspA/IM30 family protein [Bacillota bacterium]
MTNLLTKLKNVVYADLHEVLDQKEKENPISMLNHYLLQSEKEAEKVRKLVERQHALIEEFTREYQQSIELAEKRKRQAEIASQAGEANLADFAAQEHTQYADRAQHLQTAMNTAIEQLSVLEKKYEEMKHKLKDMNIRRLELMGRENVTRAHNRINKVLESNSFSDSNFSRFEKIENYLDRLEQQVNSSYFRHTIDARIAELEKGLKSEESKSIL